MVLKIHDDLAEMIGGFPHGLALGLTESTCNPCNLFTYYIKVGDTYLVGEIWARKSWTHAEILIEAVQFSKAGLLERPQRDQDEWYRGGFLNH